MSSGADRRCDLVVVGGGLGGLTAALRAAQAGRQVLVCEKLVEDCYVNNTRVCAGVFHLALTDITAPEEVLVEKITRITGGAAEPRQTRAVARDARRAVKWLQEQGVRFIRGSPEPHHNYVLAPPALIRVGLEWEGRAGDVLLRTLDAALTKAGGRILRGHEVMELLTRAGGGVAGVAGNGPDGPFRIVADNVVLADGGFASDPDLVREHISPHPDRVLQRNTKRGTGAGIRLAAAIGAAMSKRMDGFYGHLMARAALHNDKLWPYPWLDDIATTCIVVGPDGRRFCDEGLGGPHIANRVAALPDPLSSVVIFDQTIWEAGGKARSFPANPHMEAQGGEILRASTLAEVAAKVGLPPAAVEAEVTAWNAAVKAGTLGALTPPHSTDLYKPRPILNAPFFAAPACAGITYTMGGLAIDEASRVLDRHGEPILSLYAVGTTTGGLEGGDSTGYVGGLAKTAVTGLRAAEHILGMLAA